MQAVAVEWPQSHPFRHYRFVEKHGIEEVGIGKSPKGDPPIGYRGFCWRAILAGVFAVEICAKE